jgi:hypothetical protein
VLFCAVSSDRRHSSYVDKYESNLKVGLLMKQSVPPRLAPYPLHLAHAICFSRIRTIVVSVINRESLVC